MTGSSIITFQHHHVQHHHVEKIDMKTTLFIAFATILAIGAALVLRETPVTAETLRDAAVLGIVIVLLSLQAWLRRRIYTREPGRQAPHADRIRPRASASTAGL